MTNTIPATPESWMVANTSDNVSTIIGKYVKIYVDCRENFGDPRPLAYLIAAAPELLEALQAMYNVFNTENEKELESYFRKPFLIAKQAIAKAKGEK